MKKHQSIIPTLYEIVICICHSAYTMYKSILQQQPVINLDRCQIYREKHVGARSQSEN